MTYTDQVGNKIDITQPPRRIISLVPSQSEFLWDLGLREELVGITKFCIHPDEMFRTVIRVGGTKNLDLEKIRALKPDLIIGNKEENDREQIGILQKEFNVWMSDIAGLDSALQMMQDLTIILGRKEGNAIIGDIKKMLPRIHRIFDGNTVAYFIWKDPLMLCGRDTFIDAMLSHVGFKNITTETRYPVTTIEDLEERKPAYFFLSTEPFPFSANDVEKLKDELGTQRVLLVDGEMFSWYGSRLLRTESYFLELKKKLADLG